MIAPIQVHGNDLSTTLAELKREGKYAWAWDVIFPATYKLHIQNLPVPVSGNDFAGEDKRSVITPMAMPVLRKYTGTTSAGEVQGGCLSARSDATGNSISIESRLDALREILVAKGKLRPRREARKPYRDE